MTDLITEIEKDRAEGTPGPWEWVVADGPIWRLAPGILQIEGGFTDGTPDGDRIDRANARRIARVPEMEDRIIADAARIAELEARVQELEGALAWCSGSSDFNAGGVARKGWLKLCAPLLRVGEKNNG